MVMVKLVPAVLALTVGWLIAVLQVTLSSVPSDESNVKCIWLFAVTAVVLTTTVVAPAATTTDPDAADAQTAGEAELEQFVIELNVLNATPFAFPSIESSCIPCGILMGSCDVERSYQRKVSP